MSDVWMDAAWRGTTPECGKCGRIGLSFDLPNGNRVRLRIDARSARQVAETLAGYQAQQSACQCSSCASHSARLSGNSQVAGSSSEGGKNV